MRNGKKKRVIKLKKKNMQEKYRVFFIGYDSNKRDSDINIFMKAISDLWKAMGVCDWMVSKGKKMLDRILNSNSFPKKFCIYTESNYVDKVYRDIYYHHIASRHFSQPRNCIRLFFLFPKVVKLKITEKGERQAHLEHGHDDGCFGVMVLQPNGIIGRSYLDPQFFLPKGYYVRTSTYSISLLGHKFKIPGFPYMMQDQEATTCAEVTVLNLVDYYSNSYPEYNSIYLSDIENVEAQHSPERIFPSRGMSYADVSRSLAYVRLVPILYATKSSKMMSCYIFRYIYYYIESGIPFGIAADSSDLGIMHSMICVGHGPLKKDWIKDHTINYLSIEQDSNNNHSETLQKCWIANSADAYDSFVVMDDSAIPFLPVKFEACHSNQWVFPSGDSPRTYGVEYLCVPLYKRVFLNADGAEELFFRILTSRMGYHTIVDHVVLAAEYHNIGKDKTNPLIVRIFLASSRTFLSSRINMYNNLSHNKMDDAASGIYENLYCPRFVWVCELYSTESYSQGLAIGEIVVDATARQSGNTDSLDAVVLIHYPYYITYRGTDSNWSAFQRNENQLSKWCPFEQFHGNLTEIQ